jgi:vacuolar-type H+-ATPase subunit E/Vma4
MAEERSKEILRKAQDEAQKTHYQTEEYTEQMKADADAYATETLRNLREHLVSVEDEIGRTVLSIEKGLASLENSHPESSEEELYVDEPDPLPETPNTMPPLPRRASLASDTMGGPNF